MHWCIDRYLTEALAKMDLTASQGRIMGLIARQESPPCPRDIEEEFGLSHPSVSGTLSRLEKKDFIQCRPDPEDRRCKRIYILPKGYACHERIEQIIRHTEQQVVQDFTPEEQAQFSRFLDRAISNMGGNIHPPAFKEEL